MSGMDEIRRQEEVLSSKALQGLPEKFVSAMRTLFDVMDDNKTGFISLADIESRWCSDKEEGGSVPPGVIDSLRKVTPASGELSFERFCAGLKICLLRNKAEKGRQDSSSQSNDTVSENEEQSVRLTKLRQQRTMANPSPALSLPPKLEPQNVPGPPKPPRNAFLDQDRRLGDGGAASDGELEHRARAARQISDQTTEKQEGKKITNRTTREREKTTEKKRNTLEETYSTEWDRLWTFEENEGCGGGKRCITQGSPDGRESGTVVQGTAGDSTGKN